MKIRNFENGQKLTLPLLVGRFARGVTQNGAPYLSITFQDNTGEIEGKIWDVKPEQEAIIKPGAIVEITFDVNLYRQSLQARVHSVALKDQSQYELSEFVNSGNYDTAFLKEKINGFIESINDDVIKRLVVANMEAVGDAFYQYPAATRNHHDFVGGLATHVYGMLQVADALSTIYSIYNRDLLVAGVILHDMGKVEEYTAAMLSEYSVEGKLLGHISIAQANFNQIATAIGLEKEEQTLLLRHMILSHHGQLEYGSPVMPMTKEAELLNFIDNMDARTNMFEKFYGDLPEGEFSQRMFALDNRNFYKAKGVK